MGAPNPKGTSMPVITGGRVIEGAQRRVSSPTADSAADNVAYLGGLSVVRASYSFAADGGAVGTVNLVGSAVIPANAAILACFIEVGTLPTSGGAATIGLAVEGAGDMQAAAAISGAPWSTAGWKVGTKTFATAPVETTVARDIVMTIGVAALTAGTFDVYVYYMATA